MNEDSDRPLTQNKRQVALTVRADRFIVISPETVPFAGLSLTAGSFGTTLSLPFRK